MIILASQSPRRRELLSQIGIQFDTVSVDIDESAKPQESAEALVVRLAVEKARAGQKVQQTDLAVLGSDTIVVSPDGDIFGKPTDQADAFRMLENLSDNTHQVMTAIALVKGDAVLTDLVSTSVTFMPLTEQDLNIYWQTGEPQDKAGSYGIQGYAGKFVTQIEGSYSAVVGLPLYQTDQLIKAMM